MRDGKTEITFWVGWSGDEFRVVERHVAEFMKENPDIRVHPVSITNSYQKMKTAFAGDDPPDACATVWTHEVPDYALRGALEPLDGYLAKSTRKKSDYYPGVWETYVFDGKVYALSQSMVVFFVAYNKKIFRESGLDPEKPPRTIEEFDLAAEKCTKFGPGGEIIRMGFPYGGLMDWAMVFGADFWDPATRRLTFDCPALHRAARWLKGNVDKYGGYQRLRAFQSSFGNLTSPNNPFISGKVAMIGIGDWYRSLIDKYAPKDFEWGWFPYPAPRGRTREVHAPQTPACS